MKKQTFKVGQVFLLPFADEPYRLLVLAVEDVPVLGSPFFRCRTTGGDLTIVNLAGCTPVSNARALEIYAEWCARHDIPANTYSAFRTGEAGSPWGVKDADGESASIVYDSACEFNRKVATRVAGLLNLPCRPKSFTEILGILKAEGLC